jgi:hypothetical protein
LDSKVKDGTFAFLNLNLTSLGNDLESLSELFDTIKIKMDAFFEKSRANLLVVDDITTFEWIGVSVAETTRFARALNAACMKVLFISLSIVSIYL